MKRYKVGSIIKYFWYAFTFDFFFAMLLPGVHDVPKVVQFVIFYSLTLVVANECWDHIIEEKKDGR